MHRLEASTVVAAVMLLVGCTTMPPPVPVVGDRPDVAALAGTWSGDYWSPATGRNGTITFELAAGADTAFGDVLMLASRHPRATANHGDSHGVSYAPAPRTLSIAFVRAAADSVFGYLDPYPDPDCDCVLVTKFAGRLENGAIRGRYLTRNTQTSEIASGEWHVRRKR